MKSLQELEAIRKRTLDQVSLRKDHNGTRVVVGMATCGIAAGARPVLMAFVEEVGRRSLAEVTVTQAGCIGMCQYEPIVEVLAPGQDKITYARVSPDMVQRIVAEHLVNGRVVEEFTIGAAQKK